MCHNNATLMINLTVRYEISCTKRNMNFTIICRFFRVVAHAMAIF